MLEEKQRMILFGYKFQANFSFRGVG